MVSEPGSMDEGAGTRYPQLAEAVASIKQNQDQYQQNLHALQQLLQGLAQKLDVVASHVEAMVQNKAAKNTGKPEGFTQQITNPLYEETAGIQTRTGLQTRFGSSPYQRLDFPRFNGENPSGWIYRANQRTEKRYPSEILCDGLGKCTQEVAKVLHMATGKVSEVAHDVMDKKKEMEHGAKDKAENLYEEAKNTASEKAHEAKELVEDVYEKAKEKTAEKAQDGKECAQESLNKVKHTVKEAKDSGKTIMSGVVHNITEKSEEVTEDVVEKTKESTKHASNRVITFLNHAKRYISDEVTALMGVVGLMGFGTAYGMCVWVTFISSYVLARVLPRQQFGVVQSKIYPVYFTAMAYSIGLALLGHLLAHNRRLLTNRAEMFQAYNLLASILMVLVNLLYLEPSATKAMFESMKIEKEEGRGREIPTAGFSEARHEQPATHATGSGTATTMPRAEETTPSPAQENREKEEMGPRIRTTSERLKTLNSYSSFLNILTLMALTWHLVYLSQRLHLPVAC